MPSRVPHRTISRTIGRTARRGRRSLAVTAFLTALVVVSSSACSGDPATDIRDGAPPDVLVATPEGPELRYVAMGDSYSAAPGVPTTDLAEGCYRSDGNYAHLVTEAAENMKLVDVTCGGANSASLLKGQQMGETRLAPQVDSITPATDLVTVGIGGNDLQLFATIVAACTNVAASDPQGSPCTDAGTGDVDDVRRRVTAGVSRVLDRVELAAPLARVIAVGYPQLLPDSGYCPRRLPIAAGDYALINQVTRLISDVLRDEAAERDMDFVDVYAATKGHDICADDPWVNGSQLTPDGAVPYHPLAPGQAKIAELITNML